MVKCMMCRKELEYDDHGLVMDGGFAVISFHYGSRHDQLIGFENHPSGYSPPENAREKLLGCQEVRGYICDDCFENNLDLFEGYNTVRTTKEERVV